MQILYATDLHGNIQKYDDVLCFAVEHGIKLIHLGGDILPKGSGILENQKKFINGYLKVFYDNCRNQGIDVLAFFGNDDIYSRKKYFRQHATLLDEFPFEKDGYTFKAYPYVQDYPFGLKSACKLDNPAWELKEPYISSPVDCGLTGNLEIIPDIQKYFAEKGSIQEDLDNLHVDKKTIMAIHQPPWALNLDVCIGGRRVGSEAVFNWIKKEQPLAVLCGHIHENFSVTGTWTANVGRTLVIQPGQKEDQTTLVILDVEGNNIKPQIFFR